MKRMNMKEFCCSLGISPSYYAYHMDQIAVVFRKILESSFTTETIDRFFVLMTNEDLTANEIREKFGYRNVNLSKIKSDCIKALTFDKRMTVETIRCHDAITYHNMKNVLIYDCHASIKHNPKLIKWVANFTGMEPYQISMTKFGSVESETHGFTWYYVEEGGEKYYNGKRIKDVPEAIQQLAKEEGIQQCPHKMLPNELGGSWPYSLMHTVFNVRGVNYPLSNVMVQELALTISEIMKGFTEKEQAVIIGRYKQHQTLYALGKELRITSARVRQIEEKVLRKLRHASKKKLIAPYMLASQYGFPYDALLDAGIKVDHAIDVSLLKYLINPNNDYEIDQLCLSDEGFRKCLTKTFKPGSENLHHLLTKDMTDYCRYLQKQLDGEKQEEAEEFFIEELDLSVRAFNCLKKAGINTVADILDKMSGGKPLCKQVRHMGVKTEQEVYEKLKAKGFIDEIPTFEE